MKRQTQQPLRKSASGDFGKAGQAGGPMPPTDVEYPHDMASAQSGAAACTVEVMVKLMGKEDRHGAADAVADRDAMLRNQSVESPDRRTIERDERWLRGIFRIDNYAAEPGIVFAQKHRHITARRDPCRILPPKLTSPISQCAPVIERGFDQRDAPFLRYARVQRIFSQLQQAQRLRPGIPIEASIAHNPRAPCMLIRTTGVSGGKPSSSPRLIAIAWSSAVMPQRSTMRRPATTNMSGAMTLSPL